MYEKMKRLAELIKKWELGKSELELLEGIIFYEREVKNMPAFLRSPIEDVICSQALEDYGLSFSSNYFGEVEVMIRTPIGILSKMKCRGKLLYDKDTDIALKNLKLPHIPLLDRILKKVYKEKFKNIVRENKFAFLCHKEETTKIAFSFDPGISSEKMKLKEYCGNVKSCPHYMHFKDQEVYVVDAQDFIEEIKRKFKERGIDLFEIEKELEMIDESETSYYRR
jgi:hypothetical protein